VSDVVILGSDNPSADVLVYDIGRAFYQGNIIDNNNDILLLNDNGVDYEMEFEYVSEA
jgi:hypothetical protein